MNVGIVTTWFDRGAAYVSKQFEEIISQKHNVYIYARGGEEYCIDNPIWNKPNVKWGKKIKTPFTETIIDKKDFIKWIKDTNIELVIFNEQRWWYPIIWCHELKIPTIAYIDYYTKITRPLFSGYTTLICNTKRHHSAFEWHTQSYYLPWGTNIDIFKPIDDNLELVTNNIVTFFHSAGYAPERKGTDILINAASELKENFKLIIHTQKDIISTFPYLKDKINSLIENNKLIIINRTVSAPGLYHLGDVYIYPSRLDGIGLTIAEAQACGLIPVVSNNPPMNEFIDNKNGYLIDIKYLNAREDAYFWPECMPDISNLKDIMKNICNNIDAIPFQKRENRNNAIKFLNWKNNSFKLLEIIDKVKYNQISSKDIESIIKYEESGVRKLNKYIIKYYFFAPIINYMIRKLKH